MKKVIAKFIGLYFNVLSFFSRDTAGKKAFFLFSSPRRPTIKENHLAFFNSAEKFTVVANGISVQGYKWGNGPTLLLFIHGWQSHTFRWKNYIEAFPRDKYTVYAMDAPGHGLSRGKYCNIPIYSRAIEKFLEQIPPVHTVVSHSLGSMSVLCALNHTPTLNIKNLIITGTPGEGKDYVNYYTTLLGTSARMNLIIREAFVKYAGNFPEHFSAIRFASTIKIPMLSIHDEDDLETPYHHAIAIKKSAPHSQLITTKGLGHNLRSPVVVGYVLNFIEEASADVKSIQSNNNIQRTLA